MILTKDKEEFTKEEIKEQEAIKKYISEFIKDFNVESTTLEQSVYLKIFMIYNDFKEKIINNNLNDYQIKQCILLDSITYNIDKLPSYLSVGETTRFNFHKSIYKEILFNQISNKKLEYYIEKSDYTCVDVFEENKLSFYNKLKSFREYSYKELNLIVSDQYEGLKSFRIDNIYGTWEDSYKKLNKVRNAIIEYDFFIDLIDKIRKIRD